MHVNNYGLYLVKRYYRTVISIIDILADLFALKNFNKCFKVRIILLVIALYNLNFKIRFFVVEKRTKTDKNMTVSPTQPTQIKVKL